MNQLRCCYCQKPYDALQGHYCVYSSCIQGRVNRNTNFKMIVEKQNDISQFTSPVIEEESNHPPLARLELEYAKPDSSMPTNITHPATITIEELLECFQKYTSERIGGQSMVVNSEQPHRSDLKIRNNQELPLNNELCKIDYNLPSTSRILNSQMDNFQTHRTSLHFGGNEGPPMSDTGNVEDQKAVADGYNNYLVANKHRSDNVSKGTQQQSNAIKSTSLLKNNQAHGYEISGVSDEIHFITNKENSINFEFAMDTNESDDGIAGKNNKLTQMNRQLLKYGQTAQGMDWGEILGNATHDLAFKETDANQRLMDTNINAVNVTNDTAPYTGSFNTQMRWGENEVEKIRRGFPSETSENKLTFSQNETAAKGISNPSTSESVHSCSKNDASAVAGPSCSQDMERTCPVCHKEFSTKSNMKTHCKIHSGEKNFICEICQREFTQKVNLKIHMVVHSEVELHKCDMCGKCFARRDYLKSHLLTHAFGKNFKCRICGREFTQKLSLNGHLRTQHKFTP